MKCWCGMKNAHFDVDNLDETCGGMRVLYCCCGGDMCVCHNHGEVQCDGCEDCEEPEEPEPDDERESAGNRAHRDWMRSS